MVENGAKRLSNGYNTRKFDDFDGQKLGKSRKLFKIDVLKMNKYLDHSMGVNRPRETRIRAQN